MSEAATTVEEQAQTGTALEPIVQGAIQALASGKVAAYDDLLRLLEPIQAAPAVPATIPVPATLTADQKAALHKVEKVYGKVSPTERRALAPTEVEALMDERLTLDVIAEMIEKRKESIRTAVFNHLDTEIESNFEEGDRTPPQDDKGFYVRAGAVIVAALGKRFTREVRESKPVLTAEDLEALVKEGDLSKEDFLAMTTPIRVADPNKIMLAIRKTPSLVRAIARATKPGKKTASCYVRKV